MLNNEMTAEVRLDNDLLLRYINAQTVYIYGP